MRFQQLHDEGVAVAQRTICCTVLPLGGWGGWGLGSWLGLKAEAPEGSWSVANRVTLYFPFSFTVQ